jgi:hypothetical protein
LFKIGPVEASLVRNIRAGKIGDPQIAKSILIDGEAVLGLDIGLGGDVLSQVSNMAAAAVGVVTAQTI